MKDLLERLVQDARQQDMVMTQDCENGMQLLAYPLPGGMVIGIGHGPDAQPSVSAEMLLQRRTAALERCTAWQPARCGAGTLYLVRRLAWGSSEEMPVLEDDEVQAALELLT